MGNKDIVSKSILQHLAADIANLLLKLDVEKESVELLDTEQQRIEVRRADMVARMTSRQSQQSFILHVEIQNSNDPSMPSRMLRYLTDIQLAYPNEVVHQYLVYIGRERLKMAAELVMGYFTYRYRILDMNTVDCSLLLQMDTPDALVLAILCDFKQRPTQDVVNFIVSRLKELTGDDEVKFRNYFRMLETLGDNRDLQNNLDEAKAMLTEVDVKRFASYNWGLKDGRQEGRLEGRQEGQLAERVRLARQLLDILDTETIALKTGLTREEVEKLREDGVH